MTKETYIGTLQAIIFVLNLLIIAPAGFVVGEYTKAHRAFRDQVSKDMREQRRDTSATREEASEMAATIKAQADNIKQIRARLDRLERLFYVTDTNTCKTYRDGKKRRGL